MSDPFEIRSLEQVEQMERPHAQAFQSLEYVYVVSKDGRGQVRAVKRQRCHTAVPIPMVGDGAGVFKLVLQIK